MKWSKEACSRHKVCLSKLHLLIFRQLLINNLPNRTFNRFLQLIPLQASPCKFLLSPLYNNPSHWKCRLTITSVKMLIWTSIHHYRQKSSNLKVEAWTWWWVSHQRRIISWEWKTQRKIREWEEPSEPKTPTLCKITSNLKESKWSTTNVSFAIALSQPERNKQMRSSWLSQLNAFIWFTNFACQRQQSSK